jgi:hypothetical protein
VPSSLPRGKFHVLLLIRIPKRPETRSLSSINIITSLGTALARLGGQVDGNGNKRMIPFSFNEFFRTFAEYNQAVFPFQAILIAAALVATLLAARPRWSRVTAALLSFLWLWMGAVYHFLFFSSINPAAFIFAGMFISQSFLFFYYGIARERVEFTVRNDRYGIAGLVLILYSIFGYPIIGYIHGESYPAIPTFGLPCPTTIFTFGMLLWTRNAVPPVLFVVPALWSLIGFSAVTAFGVIEDLGLPIAAAVAVALLMYRELLSPSPEFHFWERTSKSSLTLDRS